MSKLTVFFNFIRTSLKRLMHYIPHILVSVILLLSLTGAACIYLSKHMYQEQSFQVVRIGYYLPADDNLSWNEFGIRMLQNLEGMKETVELKQAATVEEGYAMLERGEILYLIVVPEQFFSGIMDSTNLPLDIIVYDNTSIASYITNELFMSYASLLGIAQAGIYSALDTTRANEYTSEQVQQVSNKTNLVFLDRVMNKTNYVQTVDVANAGTVSILEQYLALAVILSLCFTAFLLIPCLQGIGNGVRECMRLYRLNTFHILFSNVMTTFAALFIAYIPCFAAISVYTGLTRWSSFIKILPILLLLAIFIAAIATFSSNAFSANMFLLFAVLLFAYCGGGLLPDAMLPKAILKISTFLPGKYVLQLMCHALFL